MRVLRTQFRFEGGYIRRRFKSMNHNYKKKFKILTIKQCNHRRNFTRQQHGEEARREYFQIQLYGHPIDQLMCVPD